MPGIDLSEHYRTVQAVVHDHLAKTARDRGIDVDDLIGDVCLKLATLNAGKRPFNPRLSSPYNYVLMVARGVLTKPARKNAYRRARASELAEQGPETWLGECTRLGATLHDAPEMAPGCRRMPRMMGHLQRAVLNLFEDEAA